MSVAERVSWFGAPARCTAKALASAVRHRSHSHPAIMRMAIHRHRRHPGRRGHRVRTGMILGRSCRGRHNGSRRGGCRLRDRSGGRARGAGIRLRACTNKQRRSDDNGARNHDDSSFSCESRGNADREDSRWARTQPLRVAKARHRFRRSSHHQTQRACRGATPIDHGAANRHASRKRATPCPGDVAARPHAVARARSGLMSTNSSRRP
jgi:hypothetical protein